MRSSILMFSGFILLVACSEEVEKTKPILGVMTESVYASVTIQPEAIYDVYAATPGILDHVFVKEGDTVTTGQLLAKITADHPQLNIENALLGVNLARENYSGQTTLLSSIADEIKSGEKQLKVDSLNYFRQQHLWEQQIGSKSELDNKKLKYELTLNNLEILRAKYRQTQLELKNGYEQSQNTLKKAQSSLSDYFIKARIDGTVYKLLKNEGELISQTEPLAQIGKSQSFLIEMLIDEVDIARIVVGQSAFIALDAYEGEVFEAVITKIYPQKNSRTQTFKVEGQFTKAPKVLYAGLSGEANIVLSEKQHAISIPLDYLLENNKVRTAEGYIAVEVGLKNLERAEVVSGLDTGMVIIKP
ncbi:MAG: efflux RND transporter periplasmic adaptor subunit [Saprospiraceae bacterium]